MVIRKARGDEAPGIWQAHSAAIRRTCATHYSPHVIELWAGFLSPAAYSGVIKDGRVLVAVNDDRVLGFGQLSAKHSEVEAIYVHPDAQGRGVGSALLRSLEQVAASRGIRSLRLASSLNAVSFYEAAGFRRRSEGTVQLPAGPEVSCVFMEKTLAL